VLESALRSLVEDGRFRPVEDAPVLTQPVYAAMHLRNRTARLHRRLTRIVGRQLASRTI
jgi:hypothetical protein